MFGSLWDSIKGWIGDSLSSMLESILNATIFKLFYYLERGLCWIIDILTDLFEVFAGLTRVSYNGKADYLINVFFSNKAITNIYWGMAIIGIILTFVFAIWSVIRKMYDVNGKQQQSLGEIIGSTVKSIFLILSMTLIINIVLSATNILMQQVNYIFSNAYHLDQPVTREFTDEEYAAMGRVLSTIGNYSMVPNSTNRYNINLCYNDIRSDMYYLQQQGVFEYSYYDTDQDGKEVKSWQSVLSKISKAYDLSLDVKVDVYNEGVSRSITEAMEYLQSNSNTAPLKSIKRRFVSDNDIHLDRMVFLAGTMNAAKNSYYNQAATMDDALRGPYYYNAGRSIYNLSQVSEDFNIGFPTDYLVVWLLAMALIYDLIVILLNCITRIFNMLFLYIIAPPVIAASPLDSGGKFKQWTIAFLVQSLSVFGTVIAMRLLTIFLPIVLGPQLQIFDPNTQPLLNMFAKFVLVFGGFEAAKKSTGLLTGILADSAGWQSIQAGDMSSTAAGVMAKSTAAVSATVGTAAGVAGFVAKPATNLVSSPAKAAASWWSNLGNWASPGGGGGGGGAAPAAQAQPPAAQPPAAQPPAAQPPAAQPPAEQAPAQQAPAQPPANNAPAQIAPPYIPRFGGANEAPTVGSAGNASLNSFRAGAGFGGGGEEGGGGKKSTPHTEAPTGHRPTL